MTRIRKHFQKLPILLLLLSGFLNYAKGQPQASGPSPKPSVLSTAISTNAFISIDGRMYLALQNSSPISIAQTHPQPRTAQSFSSAPIDIRLSPSTTLLFDDWLRVIHFDSEITMRSNLMGVHNSTEHTRPQALRQEQTLHSEVTELYLQILGSNLGVQAGRGRILFGLGLVANPGNLRPSVSEVEQWGHPPQQGDINDRLQIMFGSNGFGSQSKGLLVAAGLERTYRDDRLDSTRGDRATGFFVGSELTVQKHNLQFAAVKRDIEYAQGGTTDVWSLNTALTLKFGSVADARIHLAGELNWIRGQSTFPESVFVEDAFRVDALGAVLKASVKRRNVGFTLEGGYASGDNNRYDNTQSTYQFDPNYRVGLALFPMLNAVYSQVAVSNSADPNYRARLPRGVDRTITSGAVENTLYLYPRLIKSLTPDVQLALGYVYAWRATPHFDLFRSSLNGGVATDPLGGVGTETLGQEVNIGLSQTLMRVPFLMQFYMVGAIAYPTPTVADDDATVYASSVRMEISW